MIRVSILVGISLSCLFACSDAGTGSSADSLLDAELSRGKRAPQASPDAGGQPGLPDAPVVAGGPRVIAGNPSSCAAVIAEAPDLLTFKVDPAKSGTYTSADGALTVTIDASEKTFSFTSDVPLRWVIVKGGPAANAYEFSPPVASADGLVAPDGKGLSHLDFCYLPPPPGGGTGGAGGGGGGGAAGSGSGGTATGGTGTPSGGAAGNGTGGDGSAGDDGQERCPEECQR
jgi:hypothetical protein